MSKIAVLAEKIFKPIFSFIKDAYNTAEREGSFAAERDLLVQRQLEHLRMAEEADKKRHEKVKAMIAKTDELLKRAGDY